MPLLPPIKGNPQTSSTCIQYTLRFDYLGHGGEGIGGKGILALTLKSRLKRYMEEKGIVAVCGKPVSSPRVERRRNYMDPR